MNTISLDEYLGWQLHWRLVEMEYNVITAIKNAPSMDEEKIRQCGKHFTDSTNRLEVALHEARIMFGDNYDIYDKMRSHKKYIEYKEKYDEAKDLLVKKLQRLQANQLKDFENQLS
jgi:hypothetical protein